MLAPICALVLIQAAPPKDMNQLMDFIRSAYAHQKSYQDEWNMIGETAGNNISYKRLIAGPNSRFEMTNNGEPYMVFATNGKLEFVVLYPAKSYYVEPPAKPDNTPEPPFTTEEQSFKFQFDATGIQMGSNPPLKILSTSSEPLDGKPARHVVAEAVNPKTGGRLRASLYFWPDEWVPIDVKIEVTRAGKPTELVVRSTAKIHTGMKLDPALFTLDPNSVKDFVKISREEMIKTLNGL